jgi:hypothetical protein
MSDLIFIYQMDMRLGPACHSFEQITAFALCKKFQRILLMQIEMINLDIDADAGVVSRRA